MLEAAATAIGAGVILGSVSMGVVGMVRGWSRADIGGRGLTDGYAGGVIGVAVLLVDLLFRYGV